MCVNISPKQSSYCNILPPVEILCGHFSIRLMHRKNLDVKTLPPINLFSEKMYKITLYSDFNTPRFTSKIITQCTTICAVCSTVAKKLISCKKSSFSHDPSDLNAHHHDNDMASNFHPMQ